MFCWSEGRRASASSCQNCADVPLTAAKLPLFPSCSDRYVNHEYYMSNKMWNTQMAQGGIFAMDGTSAFGAANRVYVKCAGQHAKHP